MTARTTGVSSVAAPALSGFCGERLLHAIAQLDRGSSSDICSGVSACGPIVTVVFWPIFRLIDSIGRGVDVPRLLRAA